MLNPFRPSQRSPSDLIVHSREPFNAEPPLDRLRATFLTPQENFYVRSHGDIPRLDGATHRLRIGGRHRGPASRMGLPGAGPPGLDRAAEQA